MLTPQDIQTKEFSKAVFGGYDMAVVDEFLEEVTDDYTALYKENAVLKGKLKVLVEKVEEYRATEDAMRMALLTAQKMSDDMVEEAKKKCDEMISAAETEANGKRAALQHEYADEVAKLNAAKSQTAKFVKDARSALDQQNRYLSELENMTGFADDDMDDEFVYSPEPEPVRPVVKEAEPEQEEPSSTVIDFPDDATIRIPDVSEKTAVDADESPTRRLWTDEDEEATPRPKFDFSDLQFGSNYKGE